MNRRALICFALTLVSPLISAQPSAPIKIWVPLLAQGGIEAAEPLLRARVDAPLQIEYGPMVQINARLNKGEMPDLVVISKAAAQQLAEKGLVASQTEFVQSDVGLAVADNAPTPVLKTADDLIAFLKATPSIAYFSSGSGAMLAQFIEKNGLTEVMRSKVTVVNEGFTSAWVRDGKVASAVQAISELKSGGAKNIVPLPESMQTRGVINLVALKSATRPEVASRIMQVLTSNEAADAYKGAGLTPLFK